MSSIGFLTAEQEVRVSGREHGKLGSLLQDLAWDEFVTAFSDGGPGLDEGLVGAALDLPGWVREARPGACGDWSTFPGRVGLHIGVAGGDVSVNSPTSRGAANVREMHINTVIAKHPAVFALAARIVGQCEVNVWIAGEHRGWLADLIEQGMATAYPPPHAEPYLRATTVFSDSKDWKSRYDGWAALCAMLRDAGDGIVVLDYSVTDGFPDARWAAHPGEPGKRFRRWWDETTPEKRWNASARGLVTYTRTGPWMLQISPDNLHEASFGQTEAWTWGDLARAWREESACSSASLRGDGRSS